MFYVNRFFGQLARQLDGLWWRDGGPIVFCQLENEIGDWRYLLALRDAAQRAGMAPPLFTRTGWPAPCVRRPWADEVPSPPGRRGWSPCHELF